MITTTDRRNQVIRCERVARVLRVAPGVPNPNSFDSDGVTWLRPLSKSSVKQRAWLHAAGFEWKGGYWVIPPLEGD